jgi:putative tributyrin esterase
MALINCTFFSETLGFSTSMTVILPHYNQTLPGTISSRPKMKTLYLLHGLQDDHTAWIRQTAIERYVAPFGIAVVMPSVQRSFYTDMVFGGAYETFVADELPRLARYYFPLSDAREDNFIAGLSMGGYGAFKLALNYPENYCAAASLSGVLDLENAVNALPVEIKQDFINIFGTTPSIHGTKHDLFYAAQCCKAEKKPIPRLYQCCGDQDYLYQHNIAFRDFTLNEGLSLTWREDAGFGHSWDYWDMGIQRVIKWMFG